MKTPKEKYLNDPEYHRLVNMLESFIEQARFTPSEMREAVVLACINYEMRHIRDRVIYPSAAEAFRILGEFTTKHEPQKWQSVEPNGDTAKTHDKGK